MWHLPYLKVAILGVIYSWAGSDKTQDEPQPRDLGPLPSLQLLVIPAVGS